MKHPFQSLVAIAGAGMIFLANSLSGLSEVHTWTDNQGRNLQARIVEVGEHSIKMQLLDGRTFDYPISQLSTESQQLLESLTSKPSQPMAASNGPSVAVDKLNEVMQLPLWNEGGSLWEESAEEVAARVRIRRESQTSTSSSFRKYTLGEDVVLGTRPFSIAMYAENDKLQEVSLVFANKGDTPEDYSKRINDDGKIITSRLQELLGQPRRENSDQERFLRWDANDSTFLLAILPNEYVALRILPTSAWVDPQRARTASGTLRRELLTRINRKPNGDVILTDIPMVDQGPKGYCVPATFERTLRYYGIPADMYTLAMIGQSRAGGGTSLTALQRHLQGEVRRNGRRWDSYRARITLDDVQRWIDQGVPMLWTLNVYDSVNQRATLRSMQRNTVQDLPEWAKRERPARNVILQEIRNKEGGAHLCMIIGYNRSTNEVAISDSWGTSYEVRWIFDTELEAISLGEYHVIMP